MAPYDSDSDNEDHDFTETNVLLGYATKDATDDTTSQLGGHPTWLSENSAPSGDLAKCKNCNGLLTLLLQLNGDLPDRFPTHERRLYIFACRKKTCRRKAGSVRGIRAIRASSIPEPSQEKPKEPPKQEEAPAPAPKTHIGESLFGVKSSGPASSPLNPFSTGSASSARANPFSSSPSPAPATQQPKAEPTPQSPQQQPPSLSETFASKARISNPTPEPTPNGPKQPWPLESLFPPPYPSYFLDADYETLDSEPPSIPQQTRVDMDMDTEGPSTTTTTADDDEKASFESIMDKTFQKFADRMSQNPDQVLRYEYAGQALLYSKSDPIGRVLSSHQEATNTKIKTSSGAKSGMPRCGNCGAERVFELQLTPYAISELEAEELGIEGMEWGTIILGVCERDCVERGQKEGEVGYVEEWAGVQWEELTAKK